SLFGQNFDVSLEHPGNTRTYLLWPDGSGHTPSTDQPSNPGDPAYVKGWPVRIGMLTTELLPDVGEGSNGSPVMADVNGDGTLEIATASIDSPVYLLNADGSSYYGSDPGGYYITMNTSEFKNPEQSDAPSVASIG